MLYFWDISLIQRTKGKNRSKYTCELYITNWSYSNKVGIVFAMYQIMISKGTYWAGPRPWWAANSWYIHETSTVTTPRDALFELCYALPVIYHTLDWKCLYQPPTYQPWSSPLQKIRGHQWNSCDTWSHHMWVMTTTLGNKKQFEDNL